MLSVEIVLPEVEELHKLVKEGQEKGFLTVDEIVNAVEDVDLTKEQLEDFVAYLGDTMLVVTAIFAVGMVFTQLLPRLFLRSRIQAGNAAAADAIAAAQKEDGPDSPAARDI